MPLTDRLKGIPFRTEDYGQLLDRVDAVYLVSHPEEHYRQIRQALEQRKHVICESPLAVREQAVSYTHLSNDGNKSNSGIRIA